MLRTITEPLHNVVVVCDNAPVHSALETVFQEEQFLGALLLRASPYSASLNPTEECWSAMKAKIKQCMTATMTELLNSTPPDGMTQTEHRLLFLESAIDDSIRIITPRLCLRTYNHIQRHFGGVIVMENLQMGI